MSWFSYLILPCFFLMLFCCVWGLVSKRDRNRKVDVCTSPLWIKLLTAVYSLLVFMSFFDIDVSRIDSINKVWVSIILNVTLLICVICMGLIVWTTRITLVGNELFERNIFTSRRIEINSTCKISKRSKTHIVVDGQGHKIKLYSYLVGVQPLIERIKELINK